MKKWKKWLGGLLMALLSVGVFVGCGHDEAGEKSSNVEQEVQIGDADKKAILVVSFGTSYNDSREATIDAIEAQVKETFADYEVRRAFTSQTIINKLAERDGLEIDNVTDAMQRLYDDGYGTVICQPTHIMNGLEYDDMVAEVTAFTNRFADIRFGRPLLSSTEDYFAVAEVFMTEGPTLEDDEALVLMGHGTEHFADATYAKLDYVFDDRYEQKVFVGTVEGYPEVSGVMKKVQNSGVNKVYLLPLMIVAGDHATNDMAGDEEDSWKMIFKSEGYEVEPILKGMGEYEGVRQLFMAHIQAAIDGDDSEE